MRSGGVLVHRSGRLGAAAAVLVAELLCGDGVFTKGALERGKAVHRFDSVMSHSFNCSRLSRYDSELKLSPEIVARLDQPRRTRKPVDRRTRLAAQFAPALKG